VVKPHYAKQGVRHLIRKLVDMRGIRKGKLLISRIMNHRQEGKSRKMAGTEKEAPANFQGGKEGKKEERDRILNDYGGGECEHRKRGSCWGLRMVGKNKRRGKNEANASRENRVGTKKGRTNY